MDARAAIRCQEEQYLFLAEGAMSIKFAVALVAIACAACGGYPRNANYTDHAATPAAAQSVPQEVPIDPVLIEQACYAQSECRTTAHGLGV
jgi:hypothetical protein